MNAKSLTISRISSVSMHSFSPLFTNLSGIVDGNANSLGLLVLLHAPAAWPVQTCRETSLNHKAVAIHQSIFHMITIFVIVKQELAYNQYNPFMRTHITLCINKNMKSNSDNPFK